MSQTITLNSGKLAVRLNLSDDALLPFEPATQPGFAETAVAEALQSPLELPPLNQCVVPGDQVVVVADPETPSLPSLLAAVCEQLFLTAGAEVSVTILLPADPTSGQWQSLQDSLPEHLRRQVPVHVHDPEDEQQRSYLASSAGGERIYLASRLIDADLIVTVGLISFSGAFGYSGTTSGIYPALADTDAIRNARRIGHRELTPDDKRPLRELVDEIGWLLGLQFAVQVVPATGGQAPQVICGAAGPVMRAGQDVLDQQWRLAPDRDIDTVVVTVPGDRPEFVWKQIGSALEAASRLVTQGGRIIVVADCEIPEGPACQMLQRCREPEELLRPLSLEPPVDAIETVQLIHALQRSRVCLYSRLSEQAVEDLGMTAVTSQSELQRLVDSAGHVAVISNANYAWVGIGEAV